MVLFRALQGIAYPKRKGKFPSFKSYGYNPITYGIAGRNRNYRKKHVGGRSKSYTTALTHPLKRHEVNTDTNSISTTPQYVSLNSIPQGTGTDSERTEQRIYAKTLSYRSTILWDDGGGGAQPITVRFILASVNTDFVATNVSTFANIYDKRDFPNIGHVYKDFRVIRRETTIQATPVKFNVRINRTFKFDGDVSTDHYEPGFNKLVLIIVGDVATPTDTNTNQTLCTLRYHG